MPYAQALYPKPYAKALHQSLMSKPYAIVTFGPGLPMGCGVGIGLGVVRLTDLARY